MIPWLVVCDYSREIKQYIKIELIDRFRKMNNDNLHKDEDYSCQGK